MLGAVAQLLVRRLTRTERSATIVLYFLLTASVVSLLTIPFGWVMPTPLQFAYPDRGRIAGGAAQILLTELPACRPSVVAPFEYTSLVFR